MNDKTQSFINTTGTLYRVPVDWSRNACEIFTAKYCRKHKDGFMETSVIEVLIRLVEFWFPDNVDDKLKGTLIDDMWKQKVSPNSPQYFNAGIAKQYGVKGGDIGLWRINSSYDLECEDGVSYAPKVFRSHDTYSYPQLHACFIQPIKDSLEGITNLLQSEARLFSRGSGTGTNFSDLRGKGEETSGGGESSGLISFLEAFDSLAGAIKSGGTTRRAAKMVVLDDDHPDVLEFIDWKVGEEAKARTLIEGGYDGSWEGEAYRTVSGQNSNNSVRLSDAFMRSLADKGEWWLKCRTDDKKRYVEPKELWDRLCYAAWFCADPGVQFSGTINSWNTTPNSGEIRASNPCSEHLRLDNSACNLASINLTAFLNDKGHFDMEEYCKVIRRWVRVLDRSIDLAGYPTKEIAEGAREFRDIGLGYCGLGALLMRLCIPYDSDEGRQLAGLLAAVMNAVAYHESAELAGNYGAYPAFVANEEEHISILGRHGSSLAQPKELITDKHNLAERLSALAYFYYQEGIDLAVKRGIRNAQVTVIAPTGTIGITMDCETTGIEPVFDKMTLKTLAGGGELHTASDSIAIAQRKLGLQVGSMPPEKQHEAMQDPIFATAVDEVHGNYLSPLAHVRMLAAVQPHISGGISKTVNMPSTATVEDVSKVYLEAYTSGVKCIAVYRDGCKAQPLTADCKKCGDDNEVCEV